MTCGVCGGDHFDSECDRDAKTPPVIRRQDLDAQAAYLAVEAALRWYGDTETVPNHPSPAGRPWALFIHRLCHLRDLRKPTKT